MEGQLKQQKHLLGRRKELEQEKDDPCASEEEKYEVGQEQITKLEKGAEVREALVQKMEEEQKVALTVNARLKGYAKNHRRLLAEREQTIDLQIQLKEAMQKLTSVLEGSLETQRQQMYEHLCQAQSIEEIAFRSGREQQAQLNDCHIAELNAIIAKKEARDALALDARVLELEMTTDRQHLLLQGLGITKFFSLAKRCVLTSPVCRPTKSM